MEEATHVFFAMMIPKYGAPKSVIHDGATTVRGVFAAQLERWEAKSRQAAPHNPQANGLVEEFNRKIMRIFSSEMPLNDYQGFD